METPKKVDFVVKRYAVHEAKKWRYAVRKVKIERYAVRKVNIERYAVCKGGDTLLILTLSQWHPNQQCLSWWCYCEGRRPTVWSYQSKTITKLTVSVTLTFELIIPTPIRLIYWPRWGFSKKTDEQTKQLEHAYFRMMARRLTTLDAVAMLPASGPFRWTASKKNSVLSSKTGTRIIKLGSLLIA